jgi:hypothetical protein
MDHIYQEQISYGLFQQRKLFKGPLKLGKLCTLGLIYTRNIDWTILTNLTRIN